MNYRSVLKRLVYGGAEVRRWLSMGQGYFLDIRTPIYLAIGLKVYFPQQSYFLLGSISFLALLFFIFVGWFVDRYLKLNQRLNHISTEKYNPYFKKLKRTVSKKLK
jgi:hypothetical protein